MRLFIAIQLSGKMKEALLDMQGQLRRLGVRGNYTPPENLHLTLAFIGEYPGPDSIADVLETIDFRPFELRLKGLGSFPQLWWAGLEDSEALSALVRQLRRSLALNGIPFDKKKFLPHITLVRKPEHGGAFDPALLSLPRCSMEADELSLMLSTRGKQGMIYSQLARVKARSPLDG